MRKIILLAALMSALSTIPVKAQLCGALPNNLTNGTTADATQVMANFTTLLGCINSDGSVNNGTAGQVGYYNTTGNAISGENLSSLIDSSFSSARGSILYRGASGWTALAPGTAGDVLQTNGTTADPTWVAPSGGGGGVYTAPPCSAVTLMGDPNAACTVPVTNVLTLRTTSTTSGAHLIGVFKSFSTTFSLTVQMAPLGSAPVNTNVPGDGICLTDGTKFELFFVGVAISSIGSQTVRLAVDQANTYSSFSSSPLEVQTSSVANPAWLRMTYNTSTGVVTYSYSPDGIDYDEIYSHIVTGFLIPTAAGACGWQAVTTAAYTSGFRIYQWSGL